MPAEEEPCSSLRRRTKEDGEDQRPVGQRVRRGRFFERDQPEDALWREAGEERGRYEAEETRRAGLGGYRAHRKQNQQRAQREAERGRDARPKSSAKEGLERKDEIFWGRTREAGRREGFGGLPCPGAAERYYCCAS
jgi:hypothetical protein